MLMKSAVLLKQLTAAGNVRALSPHQICRPGTLSVEGSESAVAGLNYLIQNAGTDGREEVVMGSGAPRPRSERVGQHVGPSCRVICLPIRGSRPQPRYQRRREIPSGFTAPDLATPNGPMHVTFGV